MAPTFDPADRPDRVLVVAAHPDDIDFGAAGTVARLVEAGSAIAYCVVTDGDAGKFDEGVPRHEVGGRRREEQRAAAGKVGVTEVEFLGWPDGRLEASLDLRRDLSRVIRRVRPDLVICQSPERRWDRIYASHPDHLAAAEATIAAVYPDARNEHAHPELLADGHEPHSVAEVWVMGLEPLDWFVDITDTVDAKVAALRAHTSQTADFGDRLDDLIRGWGRQVAETGGLPAGRLAEGFRRVNTA